MLVPRAEIDRREGRGEVVSDLDRFMNFVEHDTNGGCWLWTGYCTPDDGYGRFKVRGKKMPAHRVSFALHGGNLAEHEAIIHSCDVTCCVNPAHLSGGTFKRNNDEAVERNRRKPFAGKRVTPDIRQSVLAHPGSLREIARDLSVPKTTVIKIRRQADGE